MNVVAYPFTGYDIVVFPNFLNYLAVRNQEQVPILVQPCELDGLSLKPGTRLSAIGLPVKRSALFMWFNFDLTKGTQIEYVGVGPDDQLLFRVLRYGQPAVPNRDLFGHLLGMPYADMYLTFRRMQEAPHQLLILTTSQSIRIINLL